MISPKFIELQSQIVEDANCEERLLSSHSSQFNTIDQENQPSSDFLPIICRDVIEKLPNLDILCGMKKYEDLEAGDRRNSINRDIEVEGEVAMADIEIDNNKIKAQGEELEVAKNGGNNFFTRLTEKKGRGRPRKHIPEESTRMDIESNELPKNLFAELRNLLGMSTQQSVESSVEESNTNSNTNMTSPDLSLICGTHDQFSPKPQNPPKPQFPPKAQYKGHISVGIQTNPYFGMPIPTHIEEKKWMALIARKYLGVSKSSLIKTLHLAKHTLYDWEYWYKRFLMMGTHYDSNKRPPPRVKKQDAGIVKISKDLENCITDYLELANKTCAMPLMRDIQKQVNSQGFNIGNATLRKYVKHLGYSFKKASPMTSEKVRDYVLKNKKIYLEELFSNRLKATKEQLEEVYTDESYLNDDHCRNNCWMKRGKKVTILRPQTHGAQVCIVAAISRRGWIGVNYGNMETELKISGDNHNGVFKHGSIQYFKRDNSERTDYHTNFTKEFFIEYYEQQILKYLERPSLIIMDRAAYHMMKEPGDIDIVKCTKVEVKEYLLSKGIDFSDASTVGELRALCKKVMFGGEDELTLIEKMTNKWPPPSGYKDGLKHKIMFLPQYHPEFNPIEMAWALVKKPVANTPTFNITKIMYEQLPKTFTRVDPLQSSRLFDHVDKEIERHVYYNVDSRPPKPLSGVKNEDSGEIKLSTGEDGSGYQIMPPCLSRKRFIRYIENFPFLEEVAKQGRRFGVLNRQGEEEYEGSTRMGTSIGPTDLEHQRVEEEIFYDKE